MPNGVIANSVSVLAGSPLLRSVKDCCSPHHCLQNLQSMIEMHLGKLILM